METEGVITKEVRYGESSRILTIITRDFGRISAIANNVRTNKSGLLAGTQLFCFNRFQLFKGREKSLYKIDEVRILEPFKELRESLEQMAYASYFCEVANYFIRENDPDEELLSLLLNTLFMLAKERMSFTKIKAVYELRMLAVAGYTPDLAACRNCGDTEHPGYLDTREGNLLCRDCGLGLKNLIQLNRSIRDAILFVTRVEDKRIYSFDLPPESMEYLSRLSEDYLRVQSEHEFRTLDYLKKVMALG